MQSYICSDFSNFYWIMVILSNVNSYSFHQTYFGRMYRGMNIFLF